MRPYAHTHRPRTDCASADAKNHIIGTILINAGKDATLRRARQRAHGTTQSTAQNAQRRSPHLWQLKNVMGDGRGGWGWSCKAARVKKGHMRM